MVINGLTYDSVGNRMLLKYNSLDGTRGGTTINRYTIDDIWETVLANNWTDYVVKVADTVISIETRPKRKKFKSRLVEK